MDQATRSYAHSKTTSVHCVRRIVIEAKQRPTFPGHHLPDRIVRRIPQPSSLSLSLLSLLVRIDLQEPGCCLSHSKSAFHVSGNHQVMSHQEYLSFSARVTWWLSCTVLRGLLSLLDATVGMLGHFVH